MKKVAAITGSRAEYGRLKPVLKAIDASPSLDLSLIVTGMHLSKEFGYTVREIKKDGFKIVAKVKTIPLSDTGAAMAKALGKGLVGLANVLKEAHDILLVIGDRGGMLAASIAGAHMNIPVAHIGGGHVSGSIDDRIRDAITIFSDVHFTPNKKSAGRVIALGATPASVFVVGAPDLDMIRSKEFAKPEEVSKKFNLDLANPIILVSQHPVTTEVEHAADQIKETMEAIVKMGMQTIVTYPNADAGGRRMIRIINIYRNYPFIHICKSIPHSLYLGIMNVADVMVGNSSAGIIEAPSFHLPVVNIGSRQEGREKSTNVINVDHDKKAIIKAIKKALYDTKFRRNVERCKNPYGDGKASQRIVKILSGIKITSQLRKKKKVDWRSLKMVM